MHMDRAIFDLKASVSATSLYILLCALADQGETLTLNRARVQWNGSQEELVGAAQELVQRKVLEASHPLSEDTPMQIVPSSEWR